MTNLQKKAANGTLTTDEEVQFWTEVVQDLKNQGRTHCVTKWIGMGSITDVPKQSQHSLDSMTEAKIRRCIELDDWHIV